MPKHVNAGAWIRFGIRARGDRACSAAQKDDWSARIDQPNFRTCRDDVRRDHQVTANEVRREYAQGLRPPAGHGFVDAHRVVAPARWR
jgi:hypothetical protein